MLRRPLGVAMRGRSRMDQTVRRGTGPPGPREVSVKAATVIPPPPAGWEGLGVGGGLVLSGSCHSVRSSRSWRSLRRSEPVSAEPSE
jgi:hypothetical protein